MEDDALAESKWHLDKKVPIALILALAMHAAATIWWGADITARLSQVERVQQSTAPQGDRLTRVEVRLEGVQEGINRIERTLQALSPNRVP